jgi:uncharacterized protein (DUF305 family)
MDNPTNNRKLNQDIKKDFLLPYIINIMILLSTGFISGGLVHIGFNNKNNPYYIAFGIFGCFLFVLGNYLQEKIINKKSMIGTQTIYFLLATLGLSIGVGMMSGGLQHFSDFPNYAKLLIPLGFFLSVVFYNLKTGTIKMNKFWPIVAISALLSILIFGGANYLASNSKSTNNTTKNIQALPSKDGCPAGQSKRETPSMCMTDSQLTKDYNGMEGMDMTSMVTDDKSFIQAMIPHHQEAIDTSKVIIAESKDQELKMFANQVIIDQTKEVEAMKIWFKNITDNDYKDNGMYMAMMTSMKSKTGTDLDKAYLQGMMFHHSGAIEMAKKILPISKSQDVKNLANNIVINQAKEIKTLESLLKIKFNITFAVPVEDTQESAPNEDGHIGH